MPPDPDDLTHASIHSHLCGVPRSRPALNRKEANGKVPPNLWARGDRQMTSDLAVGKVAAGSAFLARLGGDESVNLVIQRSDRLACDGLDDRQYGDRLERPLLGEVLPRAVRQNDCQLLAEAV